MHFPLIPGHQEEHYATFRAELEAIINAGDVEDGPLDVMLGGIHLPIEIERNSVKLWLNDY